MKLIYEKSQSGRRGIGVPRPPDGLDVPEMPAELLQKRLVRIEPLAGVQIEQGRPVAALQILIFEAAQPPTLGQGNRQRPYFEVLVVTPAPAARWPHIAAELRRLRRPEDAFIYEVVPVGSFEDAVCAAIINPDIAAVIIYEGFPVRSHLDVPVLRTLLASHEIGDDACQCGSALPLVGALNRLRPELDLYLLSDRHIERLAGDPEADAVRRIFYQIEEPLEMHLSILEGIRARFESPFLRYAWAS